jgi:hypothetical protein
VFIPYKPMKNIFHTIIVAKLWSMKFVMYGLPYIWTHILIMQWMYHHMTFMEICFALNSNWLEH